MADLPVETLRRLLSYDQETGNFHWIVGRGHMKPGRLAGYVAGNGYRYICLTIEGHKRMYLAHRLAWLYVTGETPSAEIDHINHSKDDNRIENLREATHGQNMANSRARTKSGLKGAYLDTNGRWHCVIQDAGKCRYIGKFDTPEDANAAYMTEARKLHGEFAYGRA